MSRSGRSNRGRDRQCDWRPLVPDSGRVGRGPVRARRHADEGAPWRKRDSRGLAGVRPSGRTRAGRSVLLICLEAHRGRAGHAAASGQPLFRRGARGTPGRYPGRAAARTRIALPERHARSYRRRVPRGGRSHPGEVRDAPAPSRRGRARAAVRDLGGNARGGCRVDRASTPATGRRHLAGGRRRRITAGDR